MRAFHVPILQRYVLREAAAGYLVTAVLLVGLVVLGGEASVARRAQGVGAALMLRLLPDLVVCSAWIALPLACVLSVAFAFSRLAESGELDAMRAAGVPARHLLPPVVLLAVGTTALLLPLVGNVQPRAVLRMRTTIGEGLRIFLKHPRPGPFSIETPSLSIAWHDLKDGEVRDLRIMSTPGIADLRDACFASSARIDYDDRRNVLTLDVADPDIIRMDPVWPPIEYHVGADRIERFEIPLQSEFTSRARLPNLTIDEIYGLGDAWSDDPETGLPARQNNGRLRSWSMAAHWTELVRRYSVPWASLLFVLVAAPMGAWVRQRSRLAAGAAAFIPVLLLYWPLLGYAETLGQTGRLNPVAAMAIPHGAVLLLGVILVRWKCWR